MDSNLAHNVDVFSLHYISRFKQLLDDDRIEDANAIGEEYVCNGEVESDDYQWLCTNYHGVSTNG